jgi:EAL domain-containing protein (putative c-di-GMP-specific phosphodiesterase class I)/CHASE2 domain-containing sensor protein
MRSDLASTLTPAKRPWRLLLWAALAAMLFGLLGIDEVFDDALRIARNNLHAEPASGQIVFVGIDDKSLRQVGRWPWSRATQAKLFEKAEAAGAERVFVDLIYDSPGTPEEDAALERTLSGSDGIVLADRGQMGVFADMQQSQPVLTRFSRHVKTASITVRYNWQNAVSVLPLSDTTTAGVRQSFAAALADREAADSRQSFPVDYSIRPLSVPYMSAADLLQGNAGSLAGKKVIVGLNADQLGDQYLLPGYGKMAGAYIHVLGAETLKKGEPIYLRWWVSFSLALAACLAAITIKPGRRRASPLVFSAIALGIGPVLLEAHGIFIDVAAGLLLLLLVSSRFAWLRMRQGGLVNDVTGLPTLQALRTVGGSASQALVVARVHNHSEIAAAVCDLESAELVRQIVARLTAGGTAKPYQGEDGTFAWLLPNDIALGNHLEALHAMFRSPVSLGTRHIDVALTFGVEIGSARSIATRLASAILAADEAWNEGLRWKLHDPSRQEEMNWRVSLLGELDSAIDQGEVWLAYQPQYDIRSGRVIGAEALARWTHPQKGPIGPAEFITLAEANGRIGKLTDFVLDRAISTAAAINQRGISFQVAVNLSARLLSDRDLLNRVQRMLVAHGLMPSKLTLELTETATLQDAECGLATLDALRSMGVKVAIDDYGTGLSTLDYLKKIPSNEIKIDQSFVKAMRVNRSDLIMVQSTISLAHSLGRTVVAEGVEDRQCLDELTRMGCDVAQGYAIGRPMGVRELVQRLHIRSSRQVA